MSDSEESDDENTEEAELNEGSDPKPSSPLTAKAKAEDDENTEEAFWAKLDEGSDPKPSSPLLEGWPGLVTPPESPAPGPGPIGRDLSHIWGPRSPSWALIRCCPQFPPAAPGPGPIGDLTQSPFWHLVDQLDDLSSGPSSAGLPPGPESQPAQPGNRIYKSDNEIIEIISTLPGNLSKCLCISIGGETAKCPHCWRVCGGPCASTRPTRPPAPAAAAGWPGWLGLPPQSQPARPGISTLPSYMWGQTALTGLYPVPDAQPRRRHPPGKELDESENTEEAFWAELDEVSARRNIDDEKPQFMTDICEELYYDIEELIARGTEAQAELNFDSTTSTEPAGPEAQADAELQYEVLFAANLLSLGKPKLANGAKLMALRG